MVNLVSLLKRASPMRPLGRMSVGQKLTLLSLTMICPIGLLIGLFYQEVAKDIAFTRAELQGLDDLEAPWRRTMAELRGQARACTAEDCGETRALGEVQDAARKLMEIADRSNLILDPELPSYYLMDVTTNKLPRLSVDMLAFIRAVRNPVSDFRSEAVADLWMSLGRLETSLIEASRAAGSASAYASPDAAHRIDDELTEIAVAGAQFRATARELAEFSHDVLEIEDPALERELKTMVSSNDELAALVEAVDAFWRVSSTELRRVLEARIARESALLTSSAVLVLLAIALTMGLIGILTRSIVQPQKALIDTARRVIVGDPSTQVPFRRAKHEIGEMARAVETLRTTLAERALLELSLQMERDLLERRVEERTFDLARAKEAAEAASQAKSTFLAAMSHEIRTPLNGVLGMASALGRTPLAPVQSQMLGVIEESGALLLTILNDVLDVSKIEAGRMELECAPFELVRAVETVAHLHRGGAAAKGLRLEVDIDPALGPWFAGDAVRVRQILHNLIGNAVKFTETGEIVVRAEPAPEGAAGVVLSVADTGIGISAAQLSQLFQKFAQGDGSITRRYGGTGLGLAISQELAVMMGGAISAESAPGVGSTFTVTLPLPAATAPAPAEVAEPAALAPPEEDAAPLKLLAADDNPLNRMVLNTLLSQVGLAATFVENGALALAAAEVDRFDLILMDVHMPEMDGLSAARAIRAGTGPNRAVPILALTADAMPESIAACLAAGMTAHIAKPIRPDALFAAMNAALAAEAQDAAA